MGFERRSKNEDERSRLENVIDYEGGGQLRTPRSVVRALDAMRFFWPPLSQVKADLADLVWIQLIKDGNTELYRWIEDYCATAALISLGTARVEEAERERKLAELLATTGSDYFQDTTYRHYFVERLPSIQFDSAKDGNGLKVFCSVSNHERDKSIRDRRLASPDHYRLYFALVNPSHVLTQEEFSSTWAAAEAGAEPLGKALLDLNTVVASGTLTKADFLLERVKSGAYEALSPVQCTNLLIAFSHVMDEAYRARPFDLFWIRTLWDRARRLIPVILFRLEPPQREAAITTVFEEGAAVGWLTSLLRHETFAHGRYGDQRRPEEEWLLTDEELNRVNAVMLGRYKTMSAHDLFSTPNPISLLFAWLQAGDEEGPQQLLEANLASDQDLVETLEALLSTIESSDRGRFEVLKKENLAPFIDFDVVRQRIDALRDHPDLGERARRLATTFKDGDHY